MKAVSGLFNTNVAIWMWWVCPPVIILFGTFGNVMTIVVLRRMSARQSAVSMSVYFIALAVSDLVVLYDRLVYMWILYNFNVDLRDLHKIPCKVIFYADYLCGMTSAWFLVAMATQRATSVVWPHRAKFICSPGKSRFAVLAILIICLLYNSHHLVNFTILPQNGTEGKCSVVDETANYVEYTVFTYVDMCFASLLPFAILLVCNVLLVWKVAQSVQKARSMGMATSTHVTSRQKKASSLTVIVIVTSAAFLLFTAPIYVVFALSGNEMRSLLSATHGDDTMELAYTICSLLWYVNPAINFYLYCLGGSAFRQEFRECFSRKVVQKRAAAVCDHLQGSRVPEAQRTVPQYENTRL